MKKKSKELRGNYIVVQSWMAYELGLKGNSLLVYAIIYGFSQSEGQICTCGDDYMATWINASPRAVVNIKNSLLADGLIEKVDAVDGDKRYSGYRAKTIKIDEKTSPKIDEKTSCIEKKLGEENSKIGEVFSSANFINKNNNIYTDFQTDKSVCQSVSACAREDETDGQTEKEFYAECIRNNWDKRKAELWGEDAVIESAMYDKRLDDILTELLRRDTVTVNGTTISATEMLKAINELFRLDSPQPFMSALVAGCASEIKKKFNYTVTALYNAAKQF